ncbi:winged helix-turn-helix transcriptional regulator [Botryobacter ruber]|uniref:winged helix-turn-helix transcriptional regulator n=1 Tax=Botryobacter ruber TaxID=2171629 RepID=UPI000E0BA6E4|nr:helix-turn-helix domain-containing protein [Botryobacter ruber]
MKEEKINKDETCQPGKEQLCPVKDIIARFGDKWSLHTILYLGQNQKLRFNELKSMISGISQRMLTVTLRALEEDGLVARTVYPEIPPKVEYALTPLGQSLLQQLLKLSDWAKLNRGKVLEARERYARKEGHLTEKST